MFKIIMNTKLLRQIIGSIEPIISNVKINATKEDLRINMIEDGRVCLISLRLNKQDAVFYDCNESELHVNLEGLLSILEHYNENDNVSLSSKSTPIERITNVIQSISIKQELQNLDDANFTQEERTFTLTSAEMGDCTVKTLPLESMKYDCSFSIDAALFERVINDAEAFSEVLTIEMNKGLVLFKSNGTPVDFSNDFLKEHSKIKDFKYTSINRHRTSDFALSYLKKIIKSASLTGEYKINFEENTPLKIEAKIGTASSLIYYLAPRVDDEEDED